MEHQTVPALNSLATMQKKTKEIFIADKDCYNTVMHAGGFIRRLIRRFEDFAGAFVTLAVI